MAPYLKKARGKTNRETEVVRRLGMGRRDGELPPIRSPWEAKEKWKTKMAKRLRTAVRHILDAGRAAHPPPFHCPPPSSPASSSLTPPRSF
eukprot:2128591-Pyramimonas_sp.AAC.1